MKFKIFLSSNRQEFHNERRLIKEAIENDIILNRFFKIFSFEEEPASGKTPQNRYSEAVLESDIYIGLLGSKYGTILEREYHLQKQNTTYSMMMKTPTSS